MPNITITHAITYTKTGTTWSFALSGSKNQLSITRAIAQDRFFDFQRRPNLHCSIPLR